MSERTGIAWATSTFNPWIGCQRVSPGCEHCYAEALVTGRMKLPVWGPTSPRKVTSESYWRQPLRWNEKAKALGEPWRVFCASLADVFEDRRDLDAPRGRLFDLIDGTPFLTWMLLTKRPENAARLAAWKTWPANVWLGTTVEDCQRALERIPALLANDGPRIRFLSMEPLLESVPVPARGIDWVIVGGESSPKARVFEPAWARRVVEECREHGIAPFVKQLGERWAREHLAKSRHGADPTEWPADLRVQEFPEEVAPDAAE